MVFPAFSSRLPTDAHFLPSFLLEIALYSTNKSLLKFNNATYLFFLDNSGEKK